jgi:hypothetical protein
VVGCRVYGLSTIVTACAECNGLLGAFPSSKIEERIEHVYLKMMKRYRDLLDMPVWSDEEIEDLGPRMRKIVVASILKREDVRKRLEVLRRKLRHGSNAS